jgi:hypothetical protein
VKRKLKTTPPRSTSPQITPTYENIKKYNFLQKNIPAKQIQDSIYKKKIKNTSLKKGRGGHTNHP